MASPSERDNHMSAGSSPSTGTPLQQQHPPGSPSDKSNSRPASITASPVNPASETSSSQPSTSSSRLRSVPIPQPLLLKKHASRSSISSGDDYPDPLSGKQQQQHSPYRQSSQLPPTMQQQQLSPTGSESPLNKKLDVDYSSSPGSEVESSSARLVVSPHPAVPRSPQQQAVFSPRYASPPAGSGGKYMVKSKRASWIDASAAASSSAAAAIATAHQHPLPTTTSNEGSSTPSTPSTPVGYPERLAKSRKSSVVEGLSTTNPSSLSSSPAGSPKTAATIVGKRSAADYYYDPTTATMHRSGSISKLRENRAALTRDTNVEHHHQGTPPSYSSSSAADALERNIMRTAKRTSCNDSDAAAAAEDVLTLPSSSTDYPNASYFHWFNLRNQQGNSQHPMAQNHGRRTSSISSIVTDSSMTDEYYSPSSSPRTGSPLQIPTERR